MEFVDFYSLEGREKFIHDVPYVITALENLEAKYREIGLKCSIVDSDHFHVNLRLGFTLAKEDHELYNKISHEIDDTLETHCNKCGCSSPSLNSYDFDDTFAGYLCDKCFGDLQREYFLNNRKQVDLYSRFYKNYKEGLLKDVPSPDFSAKNIYIFNYLIMKWL